MGIPPSSGEILFVGVFRGSTTSKWRPRRIFPVLGSMRARILVSLPYRERAAFASASSSVSNTISRSIDFSRATASAICNSSSLLALTAMFVSSLARAVRILRPPLVIPIRAGRARPISPLFLRVSLGGLAAPQRLGDQRVGQHELGFRHVFDREQKFRRLAGRRIVA